MSLVATIIQLLDTENFRTSRSAVEAVEYHINVHVFIRHTLL